MHEHSNSMCGRRVLIDSEPTMRLKLLLIACLTGSEAFSHRRVLSPRMSLQHRLSQQHHHRQHGQPFFDPLHLTTAKQATHDTTSYATATTALAAVAALAGVPGVADAAVDTAINTAAENAAAVPTTMALAAGLEQLPSALASYAHILALFVATAALTTERVLIKPGMSEEDEDLLVKADITYGVSGALVVASGYLRVVGDFGKGAEFYSHSPIFWVKMLLAAVMGASSFFPTAQIIKRAVVKSKSESGEREPMSEALAKRMTSVVNAELLALSSIPLTASLMARGVGYTNDFPWQAGAAPAFLALFGLGYKYINEALTWEEPMAVEN